MSKKGLGRGLGALIPEVDVSDREREGISEIEVSLIDRNPRQPRKEFVGERLDELAASIRQHGVVQPIVVRPRGSRFEIVAGERRWRASQMAGLLRIPALVREFSEVETMEIALIENLQREDLNPLEEAEAYQVLLKEFSLTQDELARRLGRSRPQITNTVRLLHLCPSAQDQVRSGRLSMGHAKVLLGIEDAGIQGRLAADAAVRGVSVRELEGLVRRALQGEEAASRPVPLPVGLREVEARLREWFGTPVKLHAGEKRGRIEITYFGDEGLGRILDSLGLSEERRESQPAKGRFHV